MGEEKDAAFLASEQPELFGQGLSGLMEHGARSQGSLIAAILRVIYVARPAELGSIRQQAEGLLLRRHAIFN